MMPWWGWIIVAYLFGTLAVARPLVLWAVTDKQRRYDCCPHCKNDKEWCDRCDDRNENIAILAAGGIILWPIPGIYLLGKKVLFPRGIVTKYQKQKQLQAQNEAKTKTLERQEAALRKFCETEGIPWSPYDSDLNPRPSLYGAASRTVTDATGADADALDRL